MSSTEARHEPSARFEGLQRRSAEASGSQAVPQRGTSAKSSFHRRLVHQVSRLIKWVGVVDVVVEAEVEGAAEAVLAVVRRMKTHQKTK